MVKSLSRKINKSTNINKGCFVLISIKIIKKGNVYKPKNTKGRHLYRIPGIFEKFKNNNTACIISSVDYKGEFKKNEMINCDISILNWVDEIVYNYMLKKILNNEYDDNEYNEEE